MAGPIKPKHRDTPLSMTPEPVNSLSLSRANAISRMTPDQMDANVREKFNKQTTPVRNLNKNSSRYTVINQDAIMGKAADEGNKGLRKSMEAEKKTNDYKGRQLERNTAKYGVLTNEFAKYNKDTRDVKKKR